jgi:hypothetical protein
MDSPRQREPQGEECATMADKQLFKELTACFQAATGAYYATEMRTADSFTTDRGVIRCAAALFEKTTGETSLELTPSQERSLKRALLVVAGPAGKNPYMSGVDPDDVIRMRDRIFDNALKAGLITRGPSDFL